MVGASGRVGAGTERTYAEDKAQYADRTAEIMGRIASGELTLLPGNACKVCEQEVEVGTDSLSGSTWERCRCGFRWLGAFRGVA